METTTQTLSTLTENEIKVLGSLTNQLYAEPGFSDVGCQEIATDLGLPINTIKGVVGSLTKKSIVNCENPSGAVGGDIIYLSSNFYCLHPYWSKEVGVEYVSLTTIPTSLSDFGAATKQLQDSWVADILKHNPTFKTAAIKKHLIASHFTNVTYDNVYYSLQRVKTFQPEIDKILEENKQIVEANITK